MKRLNTIVAFLITFSAFSQDLIEYNQGTFSRNGEELSIQEVERLTKEFKVGLYAKYLLYDGKRLNNIANNRLCKNSVAIFIAGTGVCSSYGAIVMGNDVKEVFDWRGLQLTLYGLGAAIIPATIYASLYFSKPNHWLNARDVSFTRLAERINKAAMQSEKSQ